MGGKVGALASEPSGLAVSNGHLRHYGMVGGPSTSREVYGMWRTLAFVTLPVLMVGWSAGRCLAQVNLPPGFEVAWITQDPVEDRYMRINNRGQVVFTRYLPRSSEIFLYDHGRLVQLTDDDIIDFYPDINDDGTIVWSRRIGPQGPYGPALEVVLWRDGKLTQLTDDEFDNESVRINNLGHVVWQKWIGGGCADSNNVICLWDGTTTIQISDADWSHQMPALNDHDEIVWTRYDWCQSPWTSDIMLYSEGVTTRLTDGQFEPQGAELNDRGQVVWDYNDDEGQEDAIQIWQDGQTTTLTDWGIAPHLNDLGDVLLTRWYEDTQRYEVWLYRRGFFYQLTDDLFWNFDGDINNRGEAIWGACPEFPQTHVRCLRRVPPVKMPFGSAQRLPH